MVSRRNLMIGAAAGAGVLLGAGWTAAAFSQSVAAAKRRVGGRGRIARTRSGAMEYAIAGAGPPFLMLHGTGGGFDQGLRFARGVVARGFTAIAPSRFGYLRSDLPPDPTPALQADNLADLLDGLGIDRLPVCGGSAGALPAAQFALRHPDRCSGLALLVPAMNLSGRDPVAFTPLQTFLVGKLLSSDFWFWSLSRLAPETLIGTLLATDPGLLRTVSPDERDRAFLILDELMPIGQRARGMMNDGFFSGAPADIAFSEIEAPILVVSCEDDRFGTAETSRTIAADAPDARLEIYPTGGHVWLGHDDDVADELSRFFRRPAN